MWRDYFFWHIIFFRMEKEWKAICHMPAERERVRDKEGKRWIKFKWTSLSKRILGPVVSTNVHTQKIHSLSLPKMCNLYAKYSEQPQKATKWANGNTFNELWRDNYHNWNNSPTKWHPCQQFWGTSRTHDVHKGANFVLSHQDECFTNTTIRNWINGS